jgi:spermidine synthase
VALTVRQRLRLLIPEYWDEHSELRHLRRVPGLGGWLFVVDTRMGGDFVRILASLGAADRVTQQSAMSLTRPERLIYRYERLMAMAFALAPHTKRALLIGLGGGSMLRYLASAFPELTATVVEREAAVIDIARHFFRVTAEVVQADGADFVAKRRSRYDVILVDVYDANGFAAQEQRFWRDCARRLAPDGVLAVNWADFVGREVARGAAEEIAGHLAHGLFITPRGLRDNLVQFASNRPLPDEEELREALPRVSRLQRPRGTLDRCLVTRAWPE